MLAGLFALALSAAALLAVRLKLIKRSIRQASAELAEIAERIEGNRTARLPQPCAELEELLDAVNRVLEAEQERRAACARQEDRLKSQVESLSHDLRTPLTAMVGYLALMDGESLDDEARASLATVRRKTAALQRLVAQFYELSQARSADARLEIGEVDVCRAVREAISERHRLLSDRGLDVRVDLPAHPLFALADPSALERVLENLLGNAGASMAGIAVVGGHMFPVFSKFRGGKGVATSLGTSLVMNPVLGLILLAFSAVGIAITRVVSVFSLISIVAFAAINPFLCGGDGFEIAYSIALAVLVVFAHRSNIQRMVNGTEMNNRLDFSRRKTGSRNLK